MVARAAGTFDLRVRHGWASASARRYRHGVLVVLRVIEHLVLGLIPGREDENLLHVADMSFVCPDNLARIEVPQLDRRIVRGGEDGSALDVHMG